MTSPLILRGGAALGLALALLGCHVDASDTPDPAHVSAQSEQVLIGGVSWYVDYEAARAVAKQSGKALWVHFGENPG